MEYAYGSNIGRRECNEDNFSVPATSGIEGLFAVADGMGGHAGGERASMLAVRGLEKRLRAESTSNQLLEAVKGINLEIYRRAQQEEECRGMGTTLVLALAQEKRYSVLNVGDSRLYHYNGTLSQITRDHSLVALMLEQGLITAEQAVRHPHRNIITRALGTNVQVEVDVYECTWEPGDMLLLCTDGLYGSVSDEDIASVMRMDAPLQEICDTLLTKALDAGATDNITVVIVRNGEVQSVE